MIGENLGSKDIYLAKYEIDSSGKIREIRSGFLLIFFVFLCTRAFTAIISIDSIDELQKIGNDPAYPPDGEYELTADIEAFATKDWNNGAGFEPIRTFMGKFNGKSHKIVNLYIHRPEEKWLGLFGYVGFEGEVKDLSVEGCIIISGEHIGLLDVGDNYVGGLIGENHGRVSNCSCIGLILGPFDVGGLIGLNGGTVSNSSSRCSVRGLTAGGLIGQNDNGIVKNCHSSGLVEGADHIGGLIGSNEYGTISKCSSTSIVEGYGGLGGLVGSNKYGTISSSYSAGSVSCVERYIYDFLEEDIKRGDDRYNMSIVHLISCVGGLVGINYEGTVSSCYGTSSVKGMEYVGGLVGFNSGDVYSCYCTGSVKGIFEVGGLAGWSVSGLIWRCYSTSKVEGAENIGGLVGKNKYCNEEGKCFEGTVSNSYWDIETSRQKSSAGGGNGKTTAEMKQQATYVDWEFPDVWAIEEGVSYPYLVALEDIKELDSFPLVKTKEISSVKELSKIGLSPDYPWWWNYELKTDIDASDTINWDDGKGFKPLQLAGQFNGNGHIIQGLYINRPEEDKVGLFRIIYLGGEVKDLGIKNCKIIGKDSIGALVGNNKGRISNCYSTGSVSGNNNVGGLVGENDKVIYDSYSACSVEGKIDVGGLIGMNYGGTISGSYCVGSVKGFDSNTGGLIGENNSGTLYKSYSKALVEGTSNVGGLVGDNIPNSTVCKCYSAGLVVGKICVGGLVGTNSADSAHNGCPTCSSIISNSYNLSPVKGNSDVGGLVGENMDRGRVNYCYNMGSVEEIECYVGGLVGTNSGGTIFCSYNAGSVKGNGHYVGGLVGLNLEQKANKNMIESSYWDIETSGQTRSVGIRNIVRRFIKSLVSPLGGEGKTTAEMKRQATYVGWDFTKIWRIKEGQTYPFFLWQPSPPKIENPIPQ